MATYYVETLRPPFSLLDPVHHRAHNAKGFSVDQLSPNMTAVFKVQDAHHKREAVARVLEYAAGIGRQVTLIMGGKRNEMGNRVSEVPQADSTQSAQ